MMDIITKNLTADEINTLNGMENFGDALMEYHNIVETVAEDYGDEATVSELRADHSELDFMDDEEIEDILKHARTCREMR